MNSQADSVSNLINWLVIIVSIVIIVSGGIWRQHKRKHPNVDMQDSPVLLGYYTSDANLLPVAKGSIDDLSYTAIVASPSTPGGESALLYQVTLPFQTKVHLLAIPKTKGVAQITPDSTIMESVELEGDYNQYFSLYTEKGMEVDARYVLDPAAMEFTMDFCASHSWEIVGNQLYFVQGNTAQAKNDPTFMEQDISKFVAEIKPAVAIPLTDDQEQQLAGYGDDLRRDYKCPVCARVMTYEQDFYQCPHNHGIMLAGQKLELARSGQLELPTLKASDNLKRSATINCPASGDPMSRQLYGNAHTMIDTCPACIYRWLDAGLTIQTIDD